MTLSCIAACAFFLLSHIQSHPAHTYTHTRTHIRAHASQAVSRILIPACPCRAWHCAGSGVVLTPQRQAAGAQAQPSHLRRDRAVCTRARSWSKRYKAGQKKCIKAQCVFSCTNTVVSLMINLQARCIHSLMKSLDLFVTIDVPIMKRKLITHDQLAFFFSFHFHSARACLFVCAHLLLLQASL